jgi:hypothetical protein
VQRSLRLGLPVAATVLASALLGLMLAGRAPAGGVGHVGHLRLARAAQRGRVAMEALLLPPDGELATNEALWSLVHEWRLSLLLPVVLLFRGRVAAFAPWSRRRPGSASWRAPRWTARSSARISRAAWRRRSTSRGDRHGRGDGAAARSRRAFDDARDRRRDSRR